MSYYSNQYYQSSYYTSGYYNIIILILDATCELSMNLSSMSFVLRGECADLPSDRDVYNAIAKLLFDTGQFSAIFVGDQPEIAEEMSRHGVTVVLHEIGARMVVQPSPGRKLRVVDYLIQVNVTIDLDGRVDGANAMLKLLRDLIGNTLGSPANRAYREYVLPEFSILNTDKYETERTPECLTMITRGQFAYMVDAATGFNQTIKGP